MKCPNCETNNGKTNKYCRACGTRLEVLASHDRDADLADARADEVALGEELFAVHELIELGDIDAALQRSESLSEDNPDSASAHAIAALVYERKSEQELAGGDPECARQFLKRAIDRYETIVDLNPDSAADRGKLASLRMKYSGHAAAATKSQPRLKITEVLSKVPRPALVSAGVFLVLVTVVIAVTTPPGNRRHSARVSQPSAQQKSMVTVTQTDTQAPDLKVYTYPQAATSASPPAPTMEIPKVPSPPSPSSFVEVRPMKLPKINQTLTLVPEPKATSKKPSTESTKQPAKPVDSKETAAAQPSASGNTLFAQAIRLHDQGKTTEAIGAANQAIVLWNGDVEAGKNVDAARRGIATANKYLSVWQGDAGQ